MHALQHLVFTFLPEPHSLCPCSLYFCPLGFISVFQIQICRDASTPRHLPPILELSSYRFSRGQHPHFFLVFVQTLNNLLPHVLCPTSLSLFFLIIILVIIFHDKCFTLNLLIALRSLLKCKLQEFFMLLS